MLSQNQLFTVISSNIASNLYSHNEKNIKNTYNNIANKKLSPIENLINNNKNKMYDSSQKAFIINNNTIGQKRMDSPFKLKAQKNIEQTPTDKIKVLSKNQKEKNLKQHSLKNKNVEKYKIFIQKLQKYLNLKEEKIKSLKLELQNKSKIINKRCFENLDTICMEIKILASKRQMNENGIKHIYKIQFLDKMEILNINKNNNIIIETRDTIEILPKVKTPLKAQKVNEMIIRPLERTNYIQILDQLAILKNNKRNKYIKIEERDKIEILPTIKTPLQAQKVNQMYIERLEIPEFLIQNLDNMIILKGHKKLNMIESRDSIRIVSEESRPLKAQHTGNMLIDSCEYNKKTLYNSHCKEILKTPRSNNIQKLRNSIEKVPQKKSPLHLKSVGDLKNQYLKKNKSENRELNKDTKEFEKDEFKIDNIGSINVYNINSKQNLNYNNYNYDNASIKPSLKMKNSNFTRRINNNTNNHKLEEISYKNKKYAYNLAKPKPSILPLSRTTKNINNITKYENKRDKNDNIYNYNNKCGTYNNSNYIREKNSNENKICNKECENKGRNVRVIRTQKNGPSIIEKRFIAHSCEKCSNYLNFKKNNSIRDNFHEIHSIKKNNLS